MNKISIILPVYNVAKYLNKCVESLINQTYCNLEIILVDDGSPDDSGKICDEWAQKDDRIKVVHKENGGVSSARNAGLAMATGDFISFVDPDDFVNLHMYEKLLNKLNQENADVCMCGFAHVYDSGEIVNIKEYNLPKLGEKISLDYFFFYNSSKKHNVIYTDNIMGSSCRSLIKREMVNDIAFPNISICEDLIFMIDVFNKARKIAVVDEYMYYYFQRSNSATVTCNETKIANFKRFAILMAEKMKSCLSENLYEAMLFYYYISPISLSVKCEDKKLVDLVAKDEFFNKLNTKENYKARQKLTKNFTRKVQYFLLHHHMYGLCSLVYKLFKNK